MTGTFGRQLMDERQFASKGSNSSRKFGKWPVGGSTIDHSTKFWSRMVSMNKIQITRAILALKKRRYYFVNLQIISSSLVLRFLGEVIKNLKHSAIFRKQKETEKDIGF